MEVKSYKDLVVWQKSMDLVLLIYKLICKFPEDEKYGLSAQLKRAAVSIPSNIAEGKAKGTRKEYRHYILNAFGSGAEIETQIEIAKRLSIVNKTEIDSICSLLSEIMKMLNALINKLEG